MKKLLYCPVCATKGVRTILGEINDDSFTIKRRYEAYQHQRYHREEVTTTMQGNFSVTCGRCNTMVYRKVK